MPINFNCFIEKYDYVVSKPENWRKDILPNDICHDHNRYNSKCYAECCYAQCNNGTARLKNVNNCLIADIYSYLETSGGQSSNLHLNVAHFFKTSVN